MAMSLQLEGTAAAVLSTEAARGQHGSAIEAAAAAAAAAAKLPLCLSSPVACLLHPHLHPHPQQRLQLSTQIVGSILALEALDEEAPRRLSSGSTHMHLRCFIVISLLVFVFKFAFQTRHPAAPVSEFTFRLPAASAPAAAVCADCGQPASPRGNGRIGAHLALHTLTVFYCGFWFFVYGSSLSIKQGACSCTCV
jgi:hypothetical protein